MDWTKNLYEGMPDDPENDADTLLANNQMARTLRSFYEACMAQGFNDEQAYGFTLIYFEGLWNTSDMVEVEEAAPNKEDDCK